MRRSVRKSQGGWEGREAKGRRQEALFACGSINGIVKRRDSLVIARRISPKEMEQRVRCSYCELVNKHEQYTNHDLTTSMEFTF